MPVITKNRETRYSEGAEIRMEADEQHISGYLAKFSVWSEKIMWFRERVLPGAFAKTIAENDIRCTFNHSPSLILGRSAAKTMELDEDETGLHYRTKLPDTSYARDLRESIKRGDITGCSFAFDTVRDKWSSDERERDLVEVRLHEGGPVTFPAYPQTEVSLRAALMSSGVELADVLAMIQKSETFASRDRRSLEEAIRILTSYLPTDAPASGHPSESSQPAPASGHPGDEQRFSRLRVLRRRLELIEAECNITKGVSA